MLAGHYNQTIKPIVQSTDFQLVGLRYGDEVDFSVTFHRLEHKSHDPRARRLSQGSRAWRSSMAPSTGFMSGAVHRGHLLASSNGWRRKLWAAVAFVVLHA